MPRVPRLRPLALLFAVALARATPGAAQEPALDLPPPPPSGAVCPAIEEDGMLCASDLWSGNCADFVAAADRLGALYRAELRKLPDSESSLKRDVWWGCGTATLFDVKRLLVTIGTAPAQAVLASEPYASLPPIDPATAAAPPVAGETCDERTPALERNRCIGLRLREARAAHQRLLERCQASVPAPLREPLAAAEASFQESLPGRCAAAGDAGDGEPSTAAFDRSRCLADAFAERDQGMVAAYPMCAAD